METLILTVAPEEAGIRVDKFLSAHCDLTRSALQTYCEEGRVLVDGKAVEKNHKLRAEQTVEVQIPPPVDLEAQPQDIPIEIVYEDDSLLVVNKPKGMVVHPAAGNMDGTLVNALLYHCRGKLSSINGVIRPGIVHRIDKDTSGLLLVAKTDKAHLSLSEQIAAHSCERVYEAVAYGTFRQPNGVVDAPIGRHPVHRKEMCVTVKGGKEAVTHYQALQTYEGFTHLRLQLETGRTHQIRVHMAYIGHPLAGDAVYGPKRVIKTLEGQCLHAKQIAFTHPETGERMHFDSPLPAYFTRFLNTLRPL